MSKGGRMAAHTQATFDAVKTIPARLKAIGVSINFFGQLVHLSSGEISNFLSGKKRLSSDYAKRFTEMVKDLELIAKAVSPIPVSFKDPETIRQVIHSFRNGDLIVGASYFGSLHLTGEGLADNF
jgi:hypothetical protein